VSPVRAPAAAPAEPDAGPPLAPDQAAAIFAACFAGPAGRLAIVHLRRLFLDRRLAPSAGDAALWHLEGQRAAAAQILALVERGRSPQPTSETTKP
jgi:hypothetical protein